MTSQKRTTYYIVFSFEHYGDIIQYFTSRECTDLESMVDYCDDWVAKFGDYYGVCFQVEVFENKNVLVYDSTSYE